MHFWHWYRDLVLLIVFSGVAARIALLLLFNPYENLDEDTLLILLLICFALAIVFAILYLRAKEDRNALLRDYKLVYQP